MPGQPKQKQQRQPSKRAKRIISGQGCILITAENGTMGLGARLRK